MMMTLYCAIMCLHLSHLCWDKSIFGVLLSVISTFLFLKALDCYDKLLERIEKLEHEKEDEKDEV